MATKNEQNNDSPRTRTTTKSNKAKKMDLISPLPCIMSDQCAMDLWMDMMPRPAKEKVMSRKKEKESRLLEKAGRAGQGDGAGMEGGWLADSVVLGGTAPLG
jgi:hypothetical protein